MAGSADTYCILSQTQAAIYGQPATLMLTITNTSSTTAYSVQSVAVWATNTQGKPTASARLVSPRFPPNAVTDVAASGTMYLPISAQFFGQAVNGASSEAPENFLVTAQVTYSDGSTISCSPLAVTLADPIFGLLPGAPPNPSVTVSSLQFLNPANSGLHLLGWV